MTTRTTQMAAMIVAGALGGAAHAGGYQLNILVDFGFGASGRSINASGQVVGTASTGLIQEAVLWNGSELPTSLLPGSFGTARGINDSGQIVGNLESEGTMPFLWDSGLTQPIMTDAQSAIAVGINNSGAVVGNAGGQAALWTQDGGTRALRFDGVTSGLGSGRDISNTGFVAGSATLSDDTFFTHAFRYDEQGGMLNLGTLGGAFSDAFGVNDAGHVVGSSDTGNGTENPFLYRNGQMIDLGLSAGESMGRAIAVNNFDQVVGFEGGGFLADATPWLWEDGVRTSLADLVDLAPNLQIVDVFDINDRGEILVTVQDTETFTNFTGVLSSVPAPATGTLGLTAFSFFGSRRRRYGSRSTALYTGSIHRERVPS